MEEDKRQGKHNVTLQGNANPRKGETGSFKRQSLLPQLLLHFTRSKERVKERRMAPRRGRGGWER